MSDIPRTGGSPWLCQHSARSERRPGQLGWQKKCNSHPCTHSCETQQLSRSREGRTSSRRRDLLSLLPQVTVGGTALSVTNPWLSLSGGFSLTFFFFVFSFFFTFLCGFVSVFFSLFFLFRWAFSLWVSGRRGSVRRGWWLWQSWCRGARSRAGPGPRCSPAAGPAPSSSVCTWVNHTDS